MQESEVRKLLPGSNWGDIEKFAAIINQLESQGVSAKYETTTFFNQAWYWRLTKDGTEGGLTLYKENGIDNFILSVFELVDESGKKLAEFDHVQYSLFCAW